MLLTLFSQTALFHIKVLFQFCTNHKNLGFRLTCQPLKWSIIKGRKGKKKLELYLQNGNRKAVGLSWELCDFYCSCVTIALYFKCKIDFFQIEKTGLVARLFMLVFGTWKICFPPHSARLVKKNYVMHSVYLLAKNPKNNK